MSVRRSRSTRSTVPRGAVLDAEDGVVAQTDDAVAGGELAFRQDQPILAEAAVGVHERAGELVEVGDVAAAEGEHDVAGEVVACMRPPVGEQARARGHRALGDDEPLALLGVSEVVAADACADTSESVPFELVALAAVLAEDDGAFALDDPGEEAAGADGRQLVRIADQDRLPLRLLDELEHGREHASLRHAGLVDDEHGPMRQSSLAAGMLEQSVQSRGGNAGLVLELLGGDAGRRRAENFDARVGEDLGDGMRGGRLARAGEPDDADDAAPARRDLAHHRLLLPGEDDPVGALDLVEPLLG